MHMRGLILGAIGATMLISAVPANAQNLPLVGGDYWDVTAVKIDDGHFGDLRRLPRQQGPQAE
jgi:hypothetical protein